MRIVQVLPGLSFGDAIGNDTVALFHGLQQMGYDTAIYAKRIDDRMRGEHIYLYEECHLTSEDVILYHLSTGSELNYEIAEQPAHLVVVYHNVTPPEFYERYESTFAEGCREGLNGARFLAKHAEYALAVSEFNKQDLIRMGYTCPIDVLPILIPFSDYDRAPSYTVMKRYQNDGYTNILFVGRVVPNKKIEDVIAAFHAYHTTYNPKSRLFIVGTHSGEHYHDLLDAYLTELDTDGIVFTGHIPFDEILAYYHLADVFLCMSEHEGFCVPLVEAMKFGVPIVAYDAAAIGDTLGGSGFLLDTKEPKVVAGVVNRVVCDKELREKMIANERERLADFEHEHIYEMFQKYLTSFIERI